MIEEIKQKCGGLELQNEDVYMAPKFGDFIQMVVRKHRGEDKEEELVINYVSWFFISLWFHSLSYDLNSKMTLLRYI